MDSPSAEPDAINLNVPTEIVFSSAGVQADNQPTTLILEEVNETGTVIATLEKLKDDGTDGDFIAGDAFFSGTFTIMGTVEGKKFYQATTVYNGKLVTSDIDFLVVTRFPVKIAPSNPDSLIKDPKSGELIYADEIIIGFKEGVSADRIAEIVANEGAKIEGTMLTSGVFQLRLSGQPSVDLVQTAVAAFSAYSEVEYAEPSFQTSIGNTSGKMTLKPPRYL